MQLPDVTGMYKSMVEGAPQLKRGIVWCHECGASQQVDSAYCLRNGWPKCCSQTMSIDSPEERQQLVTTEED